MHRQAGDQIPAALMAGNCSASSTRETFRKQSLSGLLLLHTTAISPTPVTQSVLLTRATDPHQLPRAILQRMVLPQSLAPDQDLSRTAKCSRPTSMLASLPTARASRRTSFNPAKAPRNRSSGT